MTSEIKADKWSPASGTSATIGDSGDTYTVPTGANFTVTDELKTNKISPASGTSFTMGDSGDTFTIPSGVTLANSGTATGFGALVYVGGGSTTSNVAAVTIDNVFSATYDNYLLIWDATSNENGDFIMHLRSSGGSPATQTASNYSYGFNGMDSGGGSETIHSTNDSQFQVGHGLYDNEELDYPANSGFLYFNSPFSSTHTKTFNGTFINEASNGEHRSFSGGGLFKNQTSCGGVRLSFSSDSVNNCTARMYGLVNS